MRSPWGSPVVLRYSEKDAADINKAFVGGQGPVEEANATLLLGANATLDSVYWALVAAQVRGPTHFLFFFSGHGNEEGLEVSNGLFHFERLRRALRGLNAPWSMVILDTCRAASFAAFVKEGKVAIGAIPDVGWYEALGQATPGTRLVFSKGAKRLAGEDDSLQNHRFTYAFLHGLRHACPDIGTDAASYVSDQRVFAYARWHMRNVQKVVQVPQELGLTGDFPMLRPEHDNEVGHGWFSRVLVLPHALRVEMQVSGRQFVATCLRYSLFNSSRRALHSGTYEFEPAYDGTVVTADLAFDFGWLQADPLSAAHLSLFGRASFYWALWLEDGTGDDLDAKVVHATAPA